VGLSFGQENNALSWSLASTALSFSLYRKANIAESPPSDTASSSTHRGAMMQILRAEQSSAKRKLKKNAKKKKARTDR
jgi:hypothetical protein